MIMKVLVALVISAAAVSAFLTERQQSSMLQNKDDCDMEVGVRPVEDQIFDVIQNDRTLIDTPDFHCWQFCFYRKLGWMDEHEIFLNKIRRVLNMMRETDPQVHDIAERCANPNHYSSCALAAYLTECMFEGLDLKHAPKNELAYGMVHTQRFHSKPEEKKE